MAKPKPMPTIPTRVDDAPLACIQVNEQWLAFVHAMVYPNVYPEAWEGTPQQVRQAQDDVALLYKMILEAIDCAMSGCCDGSDLVVSVINRVDPVNGSTLQSSVDGGGTWKTSPNDPRNQIVVPPPQVIGQAGFVARCDRAENIVQLYQTEVDHYAQQTGTLIQIASAIIADLLSLLLLPEGIGAALLVLVYPISQAIGQLGEELYRGLFTEEVWQAVRCAAYASLDDAGNMSTQQFSDFIHRLDVNIPGDPSPAGAKAQILYMVRATGYAGTLLGMYTGTSSGADCSSCSQTCELTDWTVVLGNETARTQTTISVDAVDRGDGTFEVRIESNNINSCCCHFGASHTGTNPTAIGYIPCGQEMVEGNFGFAYTGQAANTMVWLAPAAFSLVITTDAPCE